MADQTNEVHVNEIPDTPAQGGPSRDREFPVVDSLASVVDELFGGGRTTFDTKTSIRVVFHAAKFKQLAAVTNLFTTLLARIPKEQFQSLLESVVMAQVAAMAEGKSKNAMSLNASQLIERSMGENSLLLTVFSHVLDLLPELMPQFCSITADEFNELDLEDAIVVATGVVAVNYSFFTQKLPLLLKSALGGWRGTPPGRTTGTPARTTGAATA